MCDLVAHQSGNRFVAHVRGLDWVWLGARGAGVQTNVAATVATAGDNE